MQEDTEFLPSPHVTRTRPNVLLALHAILGCHLLHALAAWQANASLKGPKGGCSALIRAPFQAAQELQRAQNQAISGAFGPRMGAQSGKRAQQGSRDHFVKLVPMRSPLEHRLCTNRHQFGAQLESAWTNRNRQS